MFNGNPDLSERIDIPYSQYTDMHRKSRKYEIMKLWAIAGTVLGITGVFGFFSRPTTTTIVYRDRNIIKEVPVEKVVTVKEKVYITPSSVDSGEVEAAVYWLYQHRAYNRDGDGTHEVHEYLLREFLKYSPEVRVKAQYVIDNNYESLNKHGMFN